MYRTIIVATIALGALALAGKPGLASGHGNSAIASIGSSGSHGPARFGTGGATPQVRKLSPKAASACYRACMHGMDSSMENFCGVSCF
jgi:hypothetical protein